MPTEFQLAIDQICEEKGIKKEDVIETIQMALAAAYKKDYGSKGENIRAEFDVNSGQTRIFKIEEVVEEVKKPKREITLAEAKKKKKDAKIGDIIETEVTPKEISFGRIAAQTAKQVIIQRIREAEKNMLYNTFKEKEGKVINGVIQRIENQKVFVDLGQVSGILLPTDQIQKEKYKIGQRLKVYVKKVEATPKGPTIELSRTHPELVRRLFEQEVPEIAAGTVEIKSIAREAGSRTKVAVSTTKEEIDPIGAMVGQRGTRVQTVISELGGEKIDIIKWDKDPKKFIAQALAPAKIIKIEINPKEKKGIVEVAEDQLSLAIGKDGQNVRLAVKLTGWDLDIVKEKKEGEKEKIEKEKKAKAEEKTEKKEAKKKEEPKEKEKVKEEKKEMKGKAETEKKEAKKKEAKEKTKK